LDLQTFITSTLVQIVVGVSEAQKQLIELDTNAVVNPNTIKSDDRKSGAPTAVHFDVALTVVEESHSSSGEKLSGKAGFLSIVTASVSADTTGEEKGGRRNETVSRVKFEVMLAQPSDLEIKRPQKIDMSGLHQGAA
jgi:hypothetical protein